MGGLLVQESSQEPGGRVKRARDMLPLHGSSLDRCFLGRATNLASLGSVQYRSHGTQVCGWTVLVQPAPGLAYADVDGLRDSQPKFIAGNVVELPRRIETLAAEGW